MIGQEFDWRPNLDLSIFENTSPKPSGWCGTIGLSWSRMEIVNHTFALVCFGVFENLHHWVASIPRNDWHYNLGACIGKCQKPHHSFFNIHIFVNYCKVNISSTNMPLMGLIFHFGSLRLWLEKYTVYAGISSWQKLYSTWRFGALEKSCSAHRNVNFIVPIMHSLLFICPHGKWLGW